MEGFYIFCFRFTLADQGSPGTLRCSICVRPIVLGPSSVFYFAQHFQYRPSNYRSTSCILLHLVHFCYIAFHTLLYITLAIIEYAKECLRDLMSQARSDRADGVASLADWVRCISLTIRRVLQGTSWSTAFDANGFGDVRLIRPQLLTAMGLVSAPLIVANRPTPEQVRLVFPTNRIPPPELLLLPFVSRLAFGYVHIV